MVYTKYWSVVWVITVLYCQETLQWHYTLSNEIIICYLYLSPLIYPDKLIYLNFHQLEVVSRYRDTQLQVGENYA